MRLKPDSRALGRGALGDAIDGRSREGKFIRRIEAELLDQLGDNELARKLRRAHAEGQIEDADAEAISAAIEAHIAALAGNWRILIHFSRVSGRLHRSAAAARLLARWCRGWEHEWISTCYFRPGEWRSS
jgi:hypothetical protein